MLYPLIKPYNSVSIIGMCKNAGKTTALNALILECAARGEILGLTSAGRDGEPKDLVTGTKKPEIFIFEGTLAATAEQALNYGTVSRRIIGTADISTPMGEVILIRAESDGFIQLAGPSMTGQLKTVRDMLFSLGAERVLIDGAVGRRSLAAPAVSAGTILCTGASYSPDIYKTVRDTAYAVRLAGLKKTEREIPPLKAKYTLLARGEAFYYSELSDAVSAVNRGGAEAAVIKGGAADAAAEGFAALGRKLSGIEFIVEDASRVLMSRSSAEKLLRAGANLRVMTETRLIAVIVNPFSAYGGDYDKNTFTEAVRAETPRGIPVINLPGEVRKC